ncbi:MAG TPA: endolytic transglycosylase MltG, partial [Gammaproteobacteria bacterium]|nr:endolytic transglycosylase MltG [Gammaproteobacteria bacterium]
MQDIFTAIKLTVPKYCTLLIFLLMSALVLSCAAIFYYRNIALTDDYIYIVEPGESLRHIAWDMHEQEIIKHPIALIVLARMTGQAKHIQSGEYFFPENSSLADMLEKMVKGDVIMHHLR